LIFTFAFAFEQLQPVMRKKIARDKWKHFWVGIPLGAMLQVLSYYYVIRPGSAILTAMVLLIIICYGFELFSLITKLGHHDVIDAVAGILGGAIGIIVVIILRTLNVF
jgi:glycopeptide antibiotics resistance protein